MSGMPIFINFLLIGCYKFDKYSEISTIHVRCRRNQPYNAEEVTLTFKLFTLCS